MINGKIKNQKEFNHIKNSYKDECINDSYEIISWLVNETINVESNLYIYVSINRTVTNKADEANID